MLCGVFYLPPSSDGSDLSSVETTLEQLSPSKLKSLTLLGDFNIDRSPSSRHPLLNNIMSIEDKLGLKQIVTFPTRTTVTTESLIDHVYISRSVNLTCCASTSHRYQGLTMTHSWSLYLIAKSLIRGQNTEKSGCTIKPTLKELMRPSSVYQLQPSHMTMLTHFGLNDVMFLQLSSPTLFPQNKSNLKPKYHTSQPISFTLSLTTHKQVAAVFFDVKKAFDSVPHDQLLKSLSDIGITGQLLKWFADYLTGRQQRVVLDGVASNYTQVT